MSALPEGIPAGRRTLNKLAKATLHPDCFACERSVSDFTTMSNFKLYFARCVAAVWRAQSLRLAKWTFRQGPNPWLVSRRLFGSRVFVDVTRSHAQQLLYLQGERFVRERRLITSMLAPGFTVVDVGANIGYYLLMFEQVVGPTGSIVCFEPEPMNLVELKLNVTRNSFSNVSVIEKAVGSRSGRVRFGNGINGGVLSPGDSTGTEVEMGTLDQLITKKVDFVKIDVEGYEGHVLFGASSYIQKFRPRLFVEIHPNLLDPTYSLPEIEEYFKRFYRSVTYHAVLHEGRWARVVEAYSAEPKYEQEREIATVVKSSISGKYKPIFWATCSND